MKLKPIKKALKANWRRQAASRQQAERKRRPAPVRTPSGDSARKVARRPGSRAKANRADYRWRIRHRRDWDLAFARASEICRIVQPRSCGFRECGTQLAREGNAVRGRLRQVASKTAWTQPGMKSTPHDVPQDDVPGEYRADQISESICGRDLPGLFRRTVSAHIEGHPKCCIPDKCVAMRRPGANRHESESKPHTHTPGVMGVMSQFYLDS